MECHYRKYVITNEVLSRNTSSSVKVNEKRKKPPMLQNFQTFLKKLLFNSTSRRFYFLLSIDGGDGLKMTVAAVGKCRELALSLTSTSLHLCEEA